MDNEILKKLRNYHGNAYEWMNKQKQNWFIRKSYISSKAHLKENQNEKETYPVDFVVTWVDGNDPVWQADRARYILDESENEDNSTARFREWGTFKYWFRSVEKNASWVNKVYLVTYGHVPEWLDINSEKLRIINHKDFIPEEYLPTFSSHTIEWNLWRIPGLSEHFVYFNDDTFLMNESCKEDFFCNGYPKYAATAQPIRSYRKMGAHRHARLNSYGLINSYFDIRKCMEKNPEKWFSACYGDHIKYNKLAYEDGYISGMFFSHVGVPFRKSAMESFYDHFSDRVHETCLNKFRTNDDIMHQAVQMWEMFNGTFEPVGPSHYGTFISPTINNIEETIRRINGNYLMVCVNDHLGIEDADFDYIKEKVSTAYDALFPEKSSFEL